MDVIIELIARIKVKDNLKKQKKYQNVFTTRDGAAGILLKMNFAELYVNRALSKYEVK